MMYLCIRKGARGVGKVVKYTVMIPIILLFILAVNGIIKDISVSGGAGLATFFKPDFSPDTLLSFNYIGQPSFLTMLLSLFAHTFL